MKEDYLHLIWNQKRLPFHEMKLIDGNDFIVKSTGFHNKGSGPDFFDGEILIDSISWRGNIELHVKSSDWYLHEHQFDRAYDNVVLHVVYEFDKPVFINSRLVPTLELKNYIDKDHYQKYIEGIIQSSEFICSNFLLEMDTIYIESMKEKSIINRLNRKIASIDLNGFENINQILYELIGSAFGMKFNSVPFAELTKRVPLKLINKEGSNYSKVMILGVSGLFFQFENEQFNTDWEFLKSKYKMTKMFSESWVKKGVRPSGYPIVRIHQFLEVIAKFDFTTNFTKMEAVEMINYFYNLLSFDKTIINIGKLEISKIVKNTIICNSFVVFLWWYGKTKNDAMLLNKALQILNILDSEKNNITKKWTNIGVEIKKAYDSQALLEIYNEYCSRKKCLSCVIGNKILKV